MSFYVNFSARSPRQALRLLDLHAPQLPTPVLSFIRSSIENLGPAKDAQRVILVEANGHLCETGSTSASNATLKVTPIDIPD